MHGQQNIKISWINWIIFISLYESFLLLNMFRMLLRSSSEAGDCMWVYCSVMIDMYALASCLLVSVYLWVYWFVACYYNVPWMCSIVLCKRYNVNVSVCTGVLVRFGWSRVVSECRLEHCWFVRVGWHQVGSIYSTTKDDARSNKHKIKISVCLIVSASSTKTLLSDRKHGLERKWHGWRMRQEVICWQVGEIMILNAERRVWEKYEMWHRVIPSECDGGLRQCAP